MQGLLTKILETREMAYCEIPIVNAILSEKEAECRKSDIKLNVDLLFPDNISVSHVELCSIFSNLLDNAIRACNHLPQETEWKIDLSVRTKGDYVLIRCDNPSLKPSEHPDGTGYGIKILKDISKRYNGDFKTEYSDGTFSARLVLLSES